MATVNIHIPDELNEFLELKAKQINTNKEFIINKALLTYAINLKDNEEDEEDAREALAVLNNPETKYYTSEEIQQMLDSRPD